jgi:hypothetical protein
MRLPALLGVASLGLCGTLLADQLVLKNGGRITGIVVERSATRVVMEVGPGRVAFPIGNVDRIVEGRSPLSAYSERAARVSPQDREGWLELALWARDAGLETQARECFARVLALEPQNPLAQAALGNVLLNGRWLSPDEAQRARGYVRFEGSWVLPEEREDIQRERELRREEARERAAEARRAEAEAAARAAEAAQAAAAASASYGLPLGYAVYGSTPFGAPFRGGHGMRRSGATGHGHAARATPAPPTVPLPPGEIGRRPRERSR